MDLGPHAAFIWTSYAIVAAAIVVMLGWLVVDGRRYAAAIEALEARGVRRRPAAAGRGDGAPRKSDGRPDHAAG